MSWQQMEGIEDNGGQGRIHREQKIFELNVGYTSQRREDLPVRVSENGAEGKGPSK